MNLIDKNRTLMSVACHCAFCKERTGFYPQMCQTCEFDCAEDLIENQEIVEAIPVDWLERNYANNGLYCTEKYKKRAKVVKEIIEDWRARQCV